MLLLPTQFDRAAICWFKTSLLLAQKQKTE